MSNCLIIGGGIVGLCSAYYLAKKGHKITVIDRSNLRTGVSLMNAGLIIPSHFIPLASPSTLSIGLKTVFDRSSPLFIKPRLDLDLYRWLYRFVKASFRHNAEQVSDILWELNMESLILYQEMFSSKDFDFHFQKSGLLMAYQTEKARVKELKKLSISKKYDPRAVELTPNDIHRMQPKIEMDVLGGVYYPFDAHCTPSIFFSQLINYLKNKGVEFVLNEPVKSISPIPHGRYQVSTKFNEFQAEKLIVSAGIWSKDILNPLGINISMQAGKGYSFDHCTQTGIELPTLLVEGKVAITPMRGFTRFAGTMELSGVSTHVNSARVNTIIKNIKKFYPNLKVNPNIVFNTRSGLRPLAYDGLPYIGEVKGHKNLILATGHAMMGWSLGPISGKLVQQIVEGNSPLINIDVLSPCRKRPRFK